MFDSGEIKPDSQSHLIVEQTASLTTKTFRIIDRVRAPAAACCTLFKADPHCLGS
jgi:hypothetical protein